jgi:hypothetical protein
MLAVVGYRMFERPWITGGLGIGVGYLQAMLRGQERYDHPEYRAFLRRYEFQCLWHGKPKAMADLHDAIRKSHGAGGGNGHMSATENLPAHTPLKTSTPA